MPVSEKHNRNRDSAKERWKRKPGNIDGSIQLRRSFDCICLSLVFCFLYFVFVTQLHYSDERIVDIMKVYIERKKLQL